MQHTRVLATTAALLFGIAVCGAQSTSQMAPNSSVQPGMPAVRGDNSQTSTTTTTKTSKKHHHKKSTQSSTTSTTSGTGTTGTPGSTTSNTPH